MRRQRDDQMTVTKKANLQANIIGKVDTQEQLKEIIDQYALICYKGKRILHSDILREFMQEFPDNFDLIIKRVGSNQTIIPTIDTVVSALDTPELLKDFISVNSQMFNNVMEVKKLA